MIKHRQNRYTYSTDDQIPTAPAEGGTDDQIPTADSQMLGLPMLNRVAVLVDPADYSLTCMYYDNKGSDGQGVPLDTLNGIPDAGMYVVTAVANTGTDYEGSTGTFTFLVLPKNLADIDYTIDDDALVYNAQTHEFDSDAVTATFYDADNKSVPVKFAISDFQNNITQAMIQRVLFSNLQAAVTTSQAQQAYRSPSGRKTLRTGLRKRLFLTL